MYVALLQFATGSGVKITVDAPGFAKGNMDVDTCHSLKRLLGTKVRFWREKAVIFVFFL